MFLTTKAVIVDIPEKKECGCNHDHSMEGEY